MPSGVEAPRAAGWVPTSRAVALLCAALIPAVLATVQPAFAVLAVALDAAVLLLCVVDGALAPTSRGLRVHREVAPVLSSGRPNPVTLVITSSAPLSGELRDLPPATVHSEGHQQPFTTALPLLEARVPYRITPPTRGDLAFGDVHLRLTGPLGLTRRQLRLPLAQTVKVYPDLTALTRDALALARASDAPAERIARRPGEGTEFESLREYRDGDDYRTIDWKASARRGRTTVREHRPEQNQSVLLLLDCGRHMAGTIDGRRKLDHAVDAALRLAHVCLSEGDLVGVTAFATDVRAHLPAAKGREHLRALTRTLYRVEATLSESDYGRAFDFTFARQHRRALVVVFTDLLDPDTTAALVQRTLALRPRHLPLLVSLLDRDLAAAATRTPETVSDAYLRHTAARLEDDHRLTATALRNAGARVLRVPAPNLAASAVNTYLELKARSLL